MDFGTYLDTFVLLFVFVLSLLHRAFAENYRGQTLLYLIVIPLLLTSASGTYPLVTGIAFVITGVYLGKIIRKKIT